MGNSSSSSNVTSSGLYSNISSVKSKEQGLPFRVFHDYPILPGKRRSLCVDLAILNTDSLVEVAVEFKYEPSHNRSDIWPTKLKPSVVFWGDDGVGKDV